MKSRIIALLFVLTLGVIIVPVMAEAFPGEGNTCTTNPDDGSKLPECGTPDDNECNPGGVLYREENQDGCQSEWYWKAGWYLARFNDGKISREDFPKEFESVLPPLTETVSLGACYTNGKESFYYSGTISEEFIFNHTATDCSGDHVHVGTGLIVASRAAAQTICDTLVDYPYVWNPSQQDYNSPSNLWLCEDD